MPKVTAAVAALLLLVVLTGCGEESGSGASTDDTSRTASSDNESAESEASDPLVAETPEQTAADEQFLAYVHQNLLPETQIPDATDDQLIAAGHDACEQLQSGVALEDVRVVDGEKPHENGNFYDTSAIMNGAIVSYCPEFL